MRIPPTRLPLLLSLVLSLLCLAAPLQAATITVTSTANGGGSCPGTNCTLRDAIAAANATVASDTIVFAANVTGTITLLTGELSIKQPLTINGPGANVLAISGNNASRVFNVEFGVATTITGLTITQGFASGADPLAQSGGGIFSFGELTLTNCHVTGNRATFSGGGVVQVVSAGSFTGCTFSNNVAGAQGGGIFIQGNNLTVTMTNCTVTGNRANGQGLGGGIGVFDSSTLRVNNSTIANNISEGANAGGIFTSSGTSTTILRSTIIANNTLPNLQILNGATVTSQGFNLANDNGSGFLIGPGDLINTNPSLAPLGNYGGPTPTLALLVGSPALDKGISNGLTTDQRGFPRTLDDSSLANAADGTDIGAFEGTAPAGVSDQAAGSVLIYNFYASSASNPVLENTRLNLTNTSETEDVSVHLFFVDGETCSVADNYVCLTKSQTMTFLMSDIDPGVSGYIVAVAVDKQTGVPIFFNQLIGDAYIKLSSGHAANLGAEAIAAQLADPAVTDAAAMTATLNFNNISYNALPRVLAVSNLASPADANSTLLVVNRIGGDLRTRAATAGAMFGVVYDQLENPYSFTFSGGCQLRAPLTANGFPRTSPRLGSIIPAGASGWLKFWATADVPLLGAALNFNVNAASNANAFNQGRNLHKLTFTTTGSITIPVFASNCQ